MSESEQHPPEGLAAHIDVELIGVLGNAVRRVAGRSFVSREDLVREIARQIWNPWRYKGPDNVRAAARLAMSSPEFRQSLGVAQLNQSSRLDTLLRRRNTRVFLEYPAYLPKHAAGNAPVEPDPTNQPEVEDATYL